MAKFRGDRPRELGDYALKKRKHHEHFIRPPVTPYGRPKKLSISIKVHVEKPLWSLFWSVSKLSTESVGSRRELVANCVDTADATQLDSCVASAVGLCIGLKLLSP